MARVFVPGRVSPDAFSDILDPTLRNERIRQDIENQKRIYEYQQMAKEFEDWDNYNLQSRYGNKVPSKDFYDKNLAAMQYGKKGSFVGVAPSIGAGLETLGITPEGKFTFGRHGSNAVMPLRVISPRSKRMFKTDSNGTPIPLSDDEIVLAEKAKDETERQAAMDAATPVAEAPNEAHNGASEKQNEAASEVPWYDFLKHPQNTPYEQEQMRNQAIMRDAAIAAAMNKPIIYPEADTLSEPMANLAGQQNSLAQSAMGQLTSRQGMAADMYKQVTNLANSYASQAMQAQMAAQKLKANSDESANNAKVYEEQAKAVFGQMPKDMQVASNRPDFLEVVRSKHDEKALALAQQYDALKRSQAMLENDAFSKNEQANSYLAKAKAFGDGVESINRDWNLGLNFSAGSVSPYEVKKTTQPVQFASQYDVGKNEYPIATPSGASSTMYSPKVNPSKPSSKKASRAVTGANVNGYGEGLKFDPNTGSVYNEPSTTQGTKEDEITRRIKNLSTNKDVNIAKFASSGSRLNLDTGFQAAKDKNLWLTELSSIATQLAQDPKSVSKHKDFVFEVVKGTNDRFGPAANILNNSLNIPTEKGLAPYKNAISNRSGEGRIGDLETYYQKVESGLGLTKQELNDLQKILETNFTAVNTNGREKPLFESNGLKINYHPYIDPETGDQFVNPQGNKLYIFDLNDSFK